MSDKSKALRASIQDKIESIAALTDQAAFSSEVRSFVEFMGSFYNYSLYNQFLIWAQFDGASAVKGYKQWQGIGRQVIKGSKAIKILAPIIYKRCNLRESDSRYEAGNQERVVVGFRAVNVFDISQTDGDDLPSIDWGDPERCDLLWDRLLGFADKESIEVSIDPDLGSGVYGSSGDKGKVIKIKRDRDVSVLIHELAHSLLHWGGDRGSKSRAVRELEAESTAFVVGSFFGLESAGSPKYNAIYGASAELIMESADTIRKASSQIIKFCDKES